MRRFFIALVAGMISLEVSAQSGTNSPYSQYGLGVLSEQSSGFNRGMNGLGLGFRESDQVNFVNPASYSSVDSLTFLFDVGMAGQITNFKEQTEGGTRRVNANNADFEYAVAGFRLKRGVGLSFGVLPYTNIGYNYSGRKYDDSHQTYSTFTFKGSGGIHQAYLGAGIEIMHDLSIGMNISYLWGTYDRSSVHVLSESSANTLAKYYQASVRNYKVDLGVQYSRQLTRKDALTIGLTYSFGHDIGGHPKCLSVSTNSQTNLADTTFMPSNGRSTHLEIPSQYGIGVMWNHDGKWKIGLDYQLQTWGSVSSPVDVNINGVSDYVMKSGLYKDRHKIIVGGEYCSKSISKSFFERIRYRAGVSYTTPYLKINNTDGPKEMSASVGLGIPFVNSGSILNISAQWLRQDACRSLVSENTFRFNIGLTFNERWFAKWKLQ